MTTNWHYLVRQWQQDGPNSRLIILPNGQTDNIHEAYDRLYAERKPTHIYDTQLEQIIACNY